MLTNTIIDISIVTYNSAKWLTPFFDSLIQQNYPISLLNVTIHDNDSTDETFALLESLKLQHQTKFKEFNMTKSENKGFGYGHNRNFEKAKAEYFLVTNIDLTFEKNALVEVIQAAKADENNKIASWEFRQKPYEHPKYYHPVTLETRWSSSACILFSRTAFEMVKGYEERIFLYGEDVDISYRLRDLGYRLKYCPRAVCWHYAYEHANQLKSAQYFGSKLANIYLRLRFGKIHEILIGFFMYFSLFFLSVNIPNRIKILFNNLISVFKNTPYFLRTRKKSKIKFLFKYWDYDLRREGAFYSCPGLPEESLPLVSVIIRTYQGRIEWLKEAVVSVLNQTYPCIELVVIEDGSETAKNFITSLQQTNRLKNIVYQSIEKSGRCLAGNKGLSLATGEYIIFLDDDDLFFADHIEILVSALLENSTLGAAYSIAWEVPTELLQSDPLRYKESLPYINHCQSFSRYLLWNHNYLPIQSVMFRRELYVKAGGFDASLDALEDWDLWIRYSFQADFILVNKLTSLYRVPVKYHAILQREESFQKNYPVLLNKQKDMALKNISLGEFREAIKQISEYFYFIKIKRSTIKKMILKSRILYKFYTVVANLFR